MRKRLESILAEYGTVAIVVYFTIFFATLAAFFVAIRMGWRTSSAGGQAGTLAAAWLATKLTQPVRIAVTLVLTPVVAKLYERVTGRRRPAPDVERPTSNV